MKIKHFREAEAVVFDNDAAKGVTARVLIGKKDGAENFCMRVFELADGGFSPRHAHEWEHEIFVHAGRGEVFQNDAWTPVKAGDTIFIPGNEVHQIRNTGAASFTFVCIIPSGAPEI